MSTAALVPETRGLSGEDAWSTLRRVGRRRLLADAFKRLRVSDGFSHARSLAYMTCLVAVQGVIALVGLAAAAGGGGFTDLVVGAIRRMVPGPAGNVLTAAVEQATTNGSQHRYLPVLLGLVGSLISATTAFGQMERALNRLYGIEQDRPSLQKYGRAFALALTSGVLGLLAFVCLALGRNVFDTLRVGVTGSVWGIVRWPVGLLLIALAVTLFLHACPRRCQPRLSWLAFGAGVAVGLWALATIGLGLFFRLSRTFGETYGPLAGMVGLLFWALLTSIALLFGAAVAAQLEAVRQGDSPPQDRQKVAESEPEGAGQAPGHDAPLPATAR
jgi:YihY family inner membrane protein